VGIVAKGGAAFGLSLDMPAYGDAGTPEQIRMVVRYVRSLCRERGWPPGELNFPRAFLVEKAYPENELVVTAAGRGGGQEVIYERRAGRRLQFEAAVSTLFDSLDRPFDHATGAIKYNVWHNLERRAIASVGLEASPPWAAAIAGSSSPSSRAVSSDPISSCRERHSPVGRRPKGSPPDRSGLAWDATWIGSCRWSRRVGTGHGDHQGSSRCTRRHGSSSRS